MNPSLEKFNKLPRNIREKFSSAEVLAVIEKLEKESGVRLVMNLIKFLVGDLSERGLRDYLSSRGVADRKLEEIVSQFLILFREFKSFSRQPQEKKIDFSFDIEDEKDVARYRDLTTTAAPTNDFTFLADKIIGDFNFSAKDSEVLRKRLQTIILARLRGVRDDLETSENITKNIKIGGLGFSPDEANRLLKLIKDSDQGNQVSRSGYQPEKNYFTSVKKPMSLSRSTGAPITLQQKINQEQKKQAPIPTASVPVAPIKDDNLLNKIQGMITERRRPAITPPSPKSQPTKFPIIKEESGLPTVYFPDDAELMVRPKFEAEKIKPPKIKPRPFPVAHPAIRPTSTRSQELPPPKYSINQASRKPRLDDIRFAKKLFGPVEELEHLTLIDFRRLSPDPRVATEKIKEKIDLLEKDSYAQKIAGINAWHLSEVSSFYRLLGQKSLEAGQGIEQVVKDRTAAQKPTLTLAEFEAVMELNRQLRF